MWMVFVEWRTVLEAEGMLYSGKHCKFSFSFLPLIGVDGILTSCCLFEPLSNLKRVGFPDVVYARMGGLDQVLPCSRFGD